MGAIKSILIFLLAGLCEIGGGYLMWLWIKKDKPWWFGVLGAAILAAYGVVATMQTSNFARVYATYGGIFIVLSLLWGYKFDDFVPDKYDCWSCHSPFRGMHNILCTKTINQRLSNFRQPLYFSHYY